MYFSLGSSSKKYDKEWNNNQQATTLLKNRVRVIGNTPVCQTGIIGSNPIHVLSKQINLLKI